MTAEQEGKQKALVVWEGELNKYVEHFQEALPVTVRKTLGPERMIRVVLNAMWRLPALMKCTIPSVLLGVMDCAQLGLELAGPLGHAYLVPFKIKGVPNATTIVGYKGYTSLAMRSGLFTGAPWANLVREADLDRFELDLGGGQPPRHIVDPRASESDRGDVVGGYCVAPFVGGGFHTEWMSVDQINAIKARSKAKNNGPWVTDEPQMQRKTVIRRAKNQWPLTSDMANSFRLDDVADEAAERNIYLEHGDKFAASIMGGPQTVEQTAEWSDDKMEGLTRKANERPPDHGQTPEPQDDEPTDEPAPDDGTGVDLPPFDQGGPDAG